MQILGEMRAFIERHSLFAAGDPLVVALSGGADSLCLLHALRRMGYRVLAAHLDHQLRPESGAEAEAVAAVCQRLGVPLVSEARAAGRAAGEGGSVEAAARELRYRFLADVARAKGIQTIVTGHTADDQAETVLMHFLRGAGPMGLKGMRPATPLGEWVGVPAGDGLTLTRPLLPIRRQATQAYCFEVGLQPIEDASNKDRAFTRNRLRLDMLPRLKSFNPGIQANLLRIAEIMSAVDALIQGLVDARWPEVVEARPDGCLRIRTSAFGDMELALQRALLRRAVGETCADSRDLSFDVLEGARRFVLRGSGGQRHTLQGGMELLKTREAAILRQEGQRLGWGEYPQLEAEGPIPIPVPGTVLLANGWHLSARRRHVRAGGWGRLVPRGERRRIALDEGCVPGDLRLRAPQHGDRLQPFGMQGSVKVARFLMDHHIPRGARRMWPLLLKGEHILWVVGLRMAESGRMDEGTRGAIVLELTGPEGGNDGTAL